MLDWLVRHGELGEVVTNHVSLGNGSGQAWMRVRGAGTLISTWLKVLPLYTPTTEPIISGRMIMLRRCVLMHTGFSPCVIISAPSARRDGVLVTSAVLHAFLASRRRFRSDQYLRGRPCLNLQTKVKCVSDRGGNGWVGDDHLLRARAWTFSMSSGMGMTTRFSRSMPR